MNRPSTAAERSERNFACAHSLLCFSSLTASPSSFGAQTRHNCHSKSLVVDDVAARYRLKFDPFQIFHRQSVRKERERTIRMISNGQVVANSNRTASAAALPMSNKKYRNENLPPNIAQLLNASSDDPFASTEDECSESEVYPNFLRDSHDASICLFRTDESETSADVVQFFRCSRFSNVPPTIRFSLPNTKVEKPKKSIRRSLKWCYNSLIPKVIRRVLLNSHFQIVSEDTFWIGYWGRHLKTSAFKKICPYQKVNHFPGTFHLGRKDRLWMNIRRMMFKHGFDEFNIMPLTYILPRENKRLKAKMKEDGQLVPVILKPPASARGTGVRLIHRWAQIPKKEALIAQTYIDNPCLIYGSKFDLRLYAYVTCFNPLRIYLYEEGLVRFASVKYSKSLSSLANRLIHLTNYSVNKSADDNLPNRSITGVKWSVRQLWKYFESCGHDSKKLMRNIVDLIIKTFVSCESSVNSHIGQTTSYPFAFHELFGFDIVLDENLKPWLLEVNISPSLQSSTDLDVAVKTPLARDVLNLAGIQVPDKSQIHAFNAHLMPESEPSKPHCLDFRVKPNDLTLSDEETAKQMWFLENYSESGKTNSSILDKLTPNDIRVLVETEDEFDRKGRFVRIFPSPTTTKYLKYMEKVKYYNLLLEEWIGQYSHIRETGIALLETFCKDRIHLKQNLENIE